MLSPVSLILVAVMNNPRDLEIARFLGWYRIPLRTAPKVIAVDYLAFYQTGAFKGEKWRIQHIAEVRGVELTTRAELLRDEIEHPNAQQEYYKVQLGALERLEAPILAGKWKRITFFYTTGEYLQQAQMVSDLVVEANERQTLWRSLRERASQDLQNLNQDLPGFDLDPAVLSVLLGIKELESTY